MSTRRYTGDNAPNLTGSVNTDVTGASIELHLRRPDHTVLSRAAGITDAATGAWTMPWQADDLTQDGRWEVEAQITYSNGTVQTVGPDSLFVYRAIA
jgi:hypothetical protein